MSWVRLTALRRGLFGGSGGWLLIAVLVWLPRLIARVVARRDEMVATETLRPGQSLFIGTSSAQRRDRSRG